MSHPVCGSSETLEEMEEREEINVWIVEDNSVYRRGLARTLSSVPGLSCQGQFDRAESLFTALRKENRPDVVLLDVQLPGMDGITALAELQTHFPELRTIILTSFDDSEKIFRAVCAGASGYLLKSAQKEEISRAIREVFEGGAPMTPSVSRKVLDQFASGSPGGDRSRDYDLTDREKDILRLMADGLIKKEIADHLAISVHTVNTHMRSIYEKLHVNTNTGAVAKAIREDIV
ncbi:MAG: response regulator transcription factor [Verrucomicrobiota bacterium]